MSKLLTLPEGYKNGSLSAASWPGTSTSAKFSGEDRSHVSGNTETENGHTLGENINPGGSGSIYTDSEGFYSNVQTKTSSNFYSCHFIGHLGKNSIMNEETINSLTESTWTRNVVGFHCEVSAKPTGSGDTADGCGRVDQFRIAAVYSRFLSGSQRQAIMEMTEGGTRYSTQKYNENPGQGWKVLSYGLSQSDSEKVRSWKFYGWIIEMRHKKTCGGNNKAKNCTGRVRYMRPIISHGGTNDLSSSYNKSALIYVPTTTIGSGADKSKYILQTL